MEKVMKKLILKGLVLLACGFALASAQATVPLPSGPAAQVLQPPGVSWRHDAQATAPVSLAAMDAVTICVAKPDAPMKNKPPMKGGGGKKKKCDFASVDISGAVTYAAAKRSKKKGGG